MHTSLRRVIFAAFAIIFSFSISGLWARSAGNAGSINGTAADATGAILPGATISIENPVSGYSRATTSDSTGHYQFTNLPLNSSRHFSDRIFEFRSRCGSSLCRAGISWY
jgi:Carboxypeptidase regulatory-like domain